MSAISIEHEKNYAAQVVRIPEPVKAENSDRLYIVKVLGYSIIVDESWKDRAGGLAVFFPAESQISESLAWYANLNSKSELNLNQEEKGYLGKNRRIRAIKLRGNVSSALLLPLYVVAMYANADIRDFDEHAIFDTVNGLELCRKYVLPPQKQERVSAGQKKILKAFKRVDERVFPMHIETDQWMRNQDQVRDNEILVVTQKLHGSSVRFGNVPVKIKPRWYERALSKLGVRIQSHEFARIGGSRKVIKDPDAEVAQSHFYTSDIWTQALKMWGESIPENVIVYGELVGYTPDGTPIQKGFTYGEEVGDMMLYVYRVSVVTNEGGLYDLSWDQVRKFCHDYDMNRVPELWRGFKANFKLEDFDEKNFAVHSKLGYSDTIHYSDDPIKLSAGGTGRDEGIVIRVDRGDTVPTLFKYKFASFFLHETEELDNSEETGEAGIEA